MKIAALVIAFITGLVVADLDHKYYDTTPLCARGWSIDMQTDTWYNCRKDGT